MNWPVSTCGYDPELFDMPDWLPIDHNPNSTEVWVDMHYFQRVPAAVNSGDSFTRKSVPADILDRAERIVVYDFATGQPSLEDWEINWVKKLANHCPLVWLTLNPKHIDGIKTVRFDYYWNRTKKAFLDQTPTHKLKDARNFVQYPWHADLRTKKCMSYYSRTEPYRAHVDQFLKDRYEGFYNDSNNNQWLEPNIQIDNHHSFQASCAPPARHYFDQSYVTCIVETCYMNKNSILFSEKTYDHLIQGRAVLNFATPGFYQQLIDDGWKMPQGIDWSWNSILDDKARLAAYLHTVDKLLGQPIEELHQWFLDNRDVWLHNQNMLESKPYDIIDPNCIW